MTDQLKACPFCGSTRGYVERYDYSSCYRQCDDCLARGPLKVIEEEGEEIPGHDPALAAWNTRAQAEDGEAVARDVLEVARASGLRSYLHGVNADAARLILQNFINAIHQQHTESTVCKRCHGSGEVDQTVYHGEDAVFDGMIDCPECSGTGEPRAQEAGEDARDAARYRWLRDKSVHFELPDRGTPYCVYGLGMGDSNPTWGTELDAMVDYCMSPDAALSAQRGEAES